MSILRIEPNAINPGSSYTFGNVAVTGNITVTGNILPTSNNTVNLGDPTHRFGTLYLAANTIDLGGAQISATDGNITISGFGGNVDFTANVIEFLSNVSLQGPQGTIGYTGSAGDVGYTGSIGPIGYTGSAGSGGGGGISDILIASNTKPTSNLALGLQWLDTTSNVIYTYVSDGVSNAWIDTSSISVANIVGGGGGGSGTVGYSLSGTTTNATETEIFINGQSGSRYSVGTNKTVGYELNIVGKNSTDTAHAYFKLSGLVKNVNGTVSDAGNLTEIIVERTYSDWLVDARADNTNDSLNVYVQGSSGNTITWSATMTVTEA